MHLWYRPPGLGTVASLGYKRHVEVNPRCFVKGTGTSLTIRLSNANPHESYLAYMVWGEGYQEFASRTFTPASRGSFARDHLSV